MEEPLQRIAMDTVGPLPRSRSGKCYILVVCNYTTRYLEAVPLKSINAEPVVEELVLVFSWVGVPKEILMDQGSTFTSQLLKEIYHLQHVHSIRTTPYHLQTLWSTSTKPYKVNASENCHWRGEKTRINSFPIYSLHTVKSPKHPQGFSFQVVVWQICLRTPGCSQGGMECGRTEWREFSVSSHYYE